jgi:putative oxidoreductase
LGSALLQRCLFLFTFTCHALVPHTSRFIQQEGRDLKTSTNDGVLLLGRAFLCWIFLYSSFSQATEFAQNVAHVAAAGMPFPPLSIITSIAIQAICGLAILFGFRIRIAAWILFVFLIPTTIVLHKFWGLPSPHLQEVNFFKNMALIGGLLFVTQLHAGAYSLDALLDKGSSRRPSFAEQQPSLRESR